MYPGKGERYPLSVVKSVGVPDEMHPLPVHLAIRRAVCAMRPPRATTESANTVGASGIGRTFAQVVPSFCCAWVPPDERGGPSPGGLDPRDDPAEENERSDIREPESPDAPQLPLGETEEPVPAAVGDNASPP